MGLKLENNDGGCFFGSF